MEDSAFNKMKKRKCCLKGVGGKLKTKKMSVPVYDVNSILTKEETEHGLNNEGAESCETGDADEGVGDEGHDDDPGDSGYDNDQGDSQYDDDAGDAYEDDEGYSSDVEDDEDKKYLNGNVTYGYHLVRGKMGHGMEDYIVAESRKVDDYQLGLYAIFDGHSGRDVAEYLQSRLFDNILSEPDFWTHPKSAVKRAYKVTDADILENVVGSRGGSTAVTAILINGKKLVVANVGDSRAVLCRNGIAEALTIDHEPLKEKRQVESRGGFVVKMPGNVPRVDGQLAMTRAFGDGKLKAHITAKPDVVIKTIRKDATFIILASDGLWKVMSNQEACDCINIIEDAAEASEELIKEALLRESRDNISCIVVMFH